MPTNLSKQALHVVATFAFVGVAKAQLGLPYCEVRDNSTGMPSLTSASGSSDVLDDDFTLHGTGLPPQALGQFLVGRDETYLPGMAGGIGVLCIGGPLGRVTPAVQADTLGTVALTLDLGNVPHPSVPYAAINGDTLRFQLWHRDTVAGVASSNTSRALRVAFGPTELFDGRVINIPSTSYSLEVADFDGDGVLDVSIGSYEGAPVGTLTLLSGDGAGGFVHASTFDGGGTVIEHAAADLDGDGWMDILALVNVSGQGHLAWTRGLGAGMFAPPVLSPFSGGLSALGDLDGDGDLDLVGLRSEPAVAVIAHQVAPGYFRVVEQVPVGFMPVAAAIGDLDGDGAPEVVVANRLDDTLHILNNAGNGTFPSSEVVGAGRRPNALELADLDMDGDLDVVVGRAAGLTTTNISTLFNSGGVLGGRVEFAVQLHVNDVRAVDLDGDGDRDLVVSTSNGTSIDTFTNDGTGTFMPLARTLVGGGMPVDLGVGDFDGDGDLDVVTIMRFADAMQVLLKEGDGTFPSPTTVAVQGGLRQIALGDVDGDGELDLIGVASLGSGLQVLLGQGAGTFGPPMTLDSESDIAVLHVADIDGDGDLDLFTVNSHLGNRCNVHEGFGNGTFGAPVSTRSPMFSVGHELGDVDGDGLLDLVSLQPSESTVTLQLQGPARVFDAGRTFAVATGGRQLFLDDFDGDGLLDLLVLSGHSQPMAELQLFRGDGLGAFTPATTQSWPFRFNGQVHGDIDADGDLDLAVLANYGVNGAERRLLVLANRGDGTFEPGAEREFTTSLPESLALFDVEGDGDLDLFVVDARNFFLLYRAEAGRSFGERETYAGAQVLMNVQAADLDGDGDNDLVVSHAKGALVLMNYRF